MRHNDIRNELNIFSMNDRIRENKYEWKEHVELMYQMYYFTSVLLEEEGLK